MYFEAMSGMLNHGWAPLTGVLSGRDKLIDLPILERFDLAGDPAERTNLAGRAPDRDRVLTAALAAFKPALPGERVAEDADAAARLRALGYVSGNAPAQGDVHRRRRPEEARGAGQRVHRALEAFGEGHADEAAAIYRQVIERRPSMAIAYRHLAFIEWRNGNEPGAVAVLRQAVARGVTDARAAGAARRVPHRYRAGCAEGIRLLEGAAADPYAAVDALNALGIAYARAGRAADARRAFERLLDVLPGSSLPLENLGVLALDRGDVRAATDYFDRAIALAPGSSKARAGAGAAAFQSGDRNGRL